MTQVDKSTNAFDRYAVYYAPEKGSILAELGNHWLGRDPELNKSLSPPYSKNLSVDLFEKYTRTPKRYGFHGTLKAPFRLHDAANFVDLDFALEKLAGTLTKVRTEALRLKEFSNFFALVPSGACEAINGISARCVEELDVFQRPLESYELERRRLAGLTPAQDANLVKWGYPYVFDEFRFHLTLTGNVPEGLRTDFREHIVGWMAPVFSNPFEVTEICLFGDPGGGLPFRLLKRYALLGSG